MLTSTESSQITHTSEKIFICSVTTYIRTNRELIIIIIINKRLCRDSMKCTSSNNVFSRGQHQQYWSFLLSLLLIVTGQIQKYRSCDGFILRQHKTTIVVRQNHMYVDHHHKQQQQQQQQQQQIRLYKPLFPLRTNVDVSRTFSTIPYKIRTKSLSLAISATTNNIYQVGGIAGSIGILFQIGLSKLLQRYTITKDNAGYTAHTIVALCFMMYVSAIGCLNWYGWNGAIPFTALATPYQRLIGSHDTSRYMATIVTGLLLIWDIPTSIYIKSLRKVDVLVHHIVMTITSFIASTLLPMYYVYFYFGISELSSIPLLIYDQLCVWTTTTNSTNEATTDIAQSTILYHRLATIRDQVQMITAISFTIIRAVLFTFITLRYFIPDVISMLLPQSSPSNCMMIIKAILQPTISTTVAATKFQLIALRFALVASVGFTSLQLYWFAIMLRQIYQQVTRKNE